MTNPVGNDFVQQNYPSKHAEKPKSEETAVEAIYRLFPDMNDFPLTEEQACKYITWHCVPYELLPIFEQSVLDKTAKQLRDGPEQFNKVIENLFLTLTPNEKSLPVEDLVELLYKKYQEIYINEANQELQELLDKELKNHSHGSLAQQIYESAVPLIKNEVVFTMNMVRSYYPMKLIRNFLMKIN